MSCIGSKKFKYVTKLNGKFVVKLTIFYQKLLNFTDYIVCLGLKKNLTMNKNTLNIFE